jgi:hypothetical protein
MASIFNPHAKPAIRHGGPGRATAGPLVGPLVFSAMGLLTHGLALAMQGEAALAPLGFALVVGGPPLAAMVALRFVG